MPGLIGTGEDEDQQAQQALEASANDALQRNEQNAQIHAAQKQGTLSAIGTGAGVGAEVGGPWGAVIGAGVGLLGSAFSGVKL